MLIEALRAAPCKSPWATWLVTHHGTAARETREFLESCLQIIPETKHAGIRKKAEPAKFEAEQPIKSTD
jgi:hypothetical protein